MLWRVSVSRLARVQVAASHFWPHLFRSLQRGVRSSLFVCPSIQLSAPRGGDGREVGGHDVETSEWVQISLSKQIWAPTLTYYLWSCSADNSPQIRNIQSLDTLCGKFSVSLFCCQKLFSETNLKRKHRNIRLRRQRFKASDACVASVWEHPPTKLCTNMSVHTRIVFAGSLRSVGQFSVPKAVPSTFSTKKMWQTDFEGATAADKSGSPDTRPTMHPVSYFIWALTQKPAYPLPPKWAWNQWGFLTWRFVFLSPRTVHWSSVNIEPKDSSRERRIVDGMQACVGNESRQVLHFLPLLFHTCTNPTALRFFFFSPLLHLLPLPPLFLSFCLLSFLIVFKWIASFFNPDIQVCCAHYP